jgi:hypothetical protein
VSGRTDADGASLPLLSRFNVHELRAIERAIAQHLRVNMDHVDQDGFTVVPGSGRQLRVTWQGSAPIAIDDLQSIVDEATAEHTSTGPQPWPIRPGPVPKVTRKLTRGSRAKQAGDF